MQYIEHLPSALLSQHLECYWEMQLSPGELDAPFEVLAPDCTFDIWFVQDPILTIAHHSSTVRTVSRGTFFVGQKTNGIRLSVLKPTRLFGIRFKPFAFANLIQKPLHQFNDQVIELTSLFDLSRQEKKYLQLILAEATEKISKAEHFIYQLFRTSFHIDQTFRAQLNYILDRKGLIKVNHLFASFGISKVTLRNHFLEKMGLPPKMVSRIWRINFILQLKKNKPQASLTQLCLEAGFYDQAHFIKEFKYFYGVSPRQYFHQKSKLMAISQEIITKRFTNQYDPR